MSLLKIVAIISLTIVQTIALIYSLLIWKPAFQKPRIFLTLSTTIFTILLLQLSHDQLQTIAYYPITNLTFLVTFVICCILHKESTIKKWWSLVQILALSFYILHQQFKIRQVLYGLLQYGGDEMYGVVLMGVGVIGEGVFLFGVGTVMRVAVDGEDKVRFYRQAAQQAQPIMFIQLDQQAQYMQNSSPKQQMPVLVESLSWLVQISKSLLIYIAPMMDILCLLYQATTDNKISFYNGHTHKHIYPNNQNTNTSIYFHDRNNISIIGLFLIWVRIISAAIVFHLAFLIWEYTFKQFDQLGNHKIKSMFWVGALGFGVGIARMVSQWM